MISNRYIVALGVAVMQWLGWLAVASGQETVGRPCGFVRVLDAVGAGTGALECLIDGQCVRPEGYQPGNVTGGIALDAKSHTVMFRRNGVTDGQTQLDVAVNETTILIAFSQEVPAAGLQPAHWEMRILRLKQYRSDGKRTVSFVSVASDSELTVKIRQSSGTWESIQVKRLAVARASIRQARGYLPVRCNDRDLPAVSVTASGNFVSVLYNDSNGKIRSANFLDYAYSGAP